MVERKEISKELGYSIIKGGCIDAGRPDKVWESEDGRAVTERYSYPGGVDIDLTARISKSAGTAIEVKVIDRSSKPQKRYKAIHVEELIRKE